MTLSNPAAWGNVLAWNFPKMLQSSKLPNMLYFTFWKGEKEIYENNNNNKPSTVYLKHWQDFLLVLALPDYKFYSGLSLTSVQGISISQAPLESFHPGVNFSRYNFIIPLTIAIRDICIEGTLWRGYYWALIVHLNPQIFFM